MKNFIEEEEAIKLDKENAASFVKSTALLLLLAPARFIITVSGKVLYLSKSMIERSILVAAIISAVILIGNSAILYYFNKFSLNSKFFLANVLSTIIGFAAYFLFSLSDTTVHKKMNDLKPASNQQVNATDENEQVNAEANSEQEHSNQSTEDNTAIPDVTDFDLTETTPKTTSDEMQEEKPDKPDTTSTSTIADADTTSITDDNHGSVFNCDFDVSVLDLGQNDAINDNSDTSTQAKEEQKKVISNADGILRFQNSMTDKIASIKSIGKDIGKKLTEIETKKLLDEMDASTDPSLFLSDDLLTVLTETNNSVDEITPESFNIDLIPEGFKLLC